MKNGEKNKSRGIAAVWGSIGSRGRSFLYEQDQNEDENETEEDIKNGCEIVATAESSKSPEAAFESTGDHSSEPDCGNHDENKAAKSAPSRWNLWSQLGSKSGNSK